VDETGAYYTEWSKSERKTPIQYIMEYVIYSIWNLEWHTITGIFVSAWDIGC